MYIFEFIKKLWVKTYIEPKEIEEESCIPLYDATEETPPLIEEYETCEHIFMPIDSSGKMLACTKCGKLIKKDALKKKNFFSNRTP